MAAAGGRVRQWNQARTAPVEESAPWLVVATALLAGEGEIERLKSEFVAGITGLPAVAG